MITLSEISVILESLIITGLICLGILIKFKKDEQDDLDKLWKEIK